MSNIKTVIMDETTEQKLKEGAFLVRVKIKRARGNYSLGVKDFGVRADETEELKDFFSNFVKKNQITFFSQNKGGIESQLASIENKIRSNIRNHAIGADESIIPDALFDDFAVEHEKLVEEYYTLRDAIYADWFFYENTFKTKLNYAFKDLPLSPIEADGIKNKILSRIPSREAFKESFDVSLILTQLNFEIAENASSKKAKEYMQDSKDGAILELVHDILGTSLNKAFSACEKMYSAIRTAGRGRRINIKKVSEELKKKNVLDNQKIQLIAESLEKISNNLDGSSSELELGNLESLASQIYCYAVEIGVEKQIEVDPEVFSEEYLLAIYDDNYKIPA